MATTNCSSQEAITAHNKIKNLFVISHSIRMLDLPLNELKLVAGNRGIKGYKRMLKKRLLNALNKSKLLESKNSFNDKRLKKIREDFNKLRDRFLFKTKNKRN